MGLRKGDEWKAMPKVEKWDFLTEAKSGNPWETVKERMLEMRWDDE